MQALGDQAFLDYLKRCALASELVCDDIDEFFVQPAEDSDKKTLDELCTKRLGGDRKLQGLVVQALRIMGCPERPAAESAIPIRERVRAARRILLKLAARRYPKMAYRLHDSLRLTGEITTTSIANEYNGADARYDLERKIEKRCALPMGTIYIHCPVRNTSMKVARALVVGNNLRKVGHLRDVTKIYDGGDELKPYKEEIEAIEKMYASIWRLHIYVDAAYVERTDLIKMVAKEELKFPTDTLMTFQQEDSSKMGENVFSRLCLHTSKFASDHLPRVVKQLDETHTRFRNTPETSAEAADAQIMEAISRVNKIVQQEANLLQHARTSGREKPKRG
jgi:hypothetical protein